MFVILKRHAAQTIERSQPFATMNTFAVGKTSVCYHAYIHSNTSTREDAPEDT